MKTRYAFFGIALAALAFFGAAPTTAQDFNDAVQGYVWADQPSSGNYTPDPTYSYNSSGGAVEIDRSSVGTYAVTFFGLGPVAGGGNVQVTARIDGGPARCNIASWESTGPDLLISIRCYDPAGALVDTPYDVLFTSTAGGISGFAYAWANDAGSASYTPNADFSYNGGGGAITATRSGVGVYTMTFVGIAGASGGHYQVSAYGNGSAFCSHDGWDAETVFIECFNAAGSPANVRYTVLYVETTDVVDGLGYAWANEPASASYSPNAFYAYNSKGGGITATRSSAGDYRMTFSDLVGTAGAGGHVQVSSDSGSAVYCSTVGWGSDSPDFVVDVFCFDETGALVDSWYNILVVWPERAPVANEPAAELPSTLALHAAYPNPFNPSTTLRYDLAEAGNVRIAVFDMLGREVVELLNQQQAAGSHEISFDAEGLPTGTYIARMEAGGEVRAQRLTLIR
ncbi:MAG: T9SS type A sorting domain-containing protein [Bacteroidetes bacterium]|nr:T9SS type A sorting domain-containing protein [Bacteroidota bacterium]